MGEFDGGLSILSLIYMVNEKLGASVLLLLHTCPSGAYPSSSLILWHLLSSKGVSSKHPWAHSQHTPCPPGSYSILFELLKRKRRKVTFLGENVCVLSPIFTSQAVENRTVSFREVPGSWKGCRVHRSKEC